MSTSTTPRPGDEWFPTATDGLPTSVPTRSVELADGSVYELTVGPVAHRVDGRTLRMLAYNGSIPGPTLIVVQGSTISVDVVNHGDLETTVHWHGLRGRNDADGVPGETQPPIPVGGRHRVHLHFPDAGVYWYHPHVREDYAQEVGLAGAILVRPAAAGDWPPAHRDLVVVIDDLLVDEHGIVPFRRHGVDHVAMGRFGNVVLVDGSTSTRFQVGVGEIVRWHLVNAAGSRVFRVGFPGGRMKLVGGDNGRVEQTELVTGVLLAPSERAIVDVRHIRPGPQLLQHRTPTRATTLATIDVAGSVTTLAEPFDTVRSDPGLAMERRDLARWLDAAPDKELSFTVTIDESSPASPIHHHHHHHHHDESGSDHDGIEWEDTMADLNAATTTADTRWQLVDRATGAVNEAIDWRFQVGERIKLRLINEPHSDHPMHHPFHIHGAGRFLVLRRDDAVERNLMWKDTVLVRTGQTVDLLVELTNPGRWMAHCHISEHLQGGMMFSFTVDAA